MTFKIGANTAFTVGGIPFLWGSGDQTTVPSNQVKIKAGDASSEQYFGYSVAVGCGRIVVGAEGDDSSAVNSGAAYIYNLSGTQLAKIKANDPASVDTFGRSVAVGCGRIVVGALFGEVSQPSSGSAYVFNLNGTLLTEISPSDGANSDSFGQSVAVGSGRIVVGSPLNTNLSVQTGSAYIYNLSGTQLAKIKASDGASGDRFGWSVAVGCGRIVAGAYFDDDNGTDSGSAYIFDLSGTQLFKIKASEGQSNDFFGHSVAIGCGRIVVGAYGDDDNGSSSGSAYIFDLNGNQIAKIKPSDPIAGDLFGHSVAIGSGRIVVGAIGVGDLGTNSGATYVFDLDGIQLAKIKPSDGHSFNYFGQSVAVGSGRIVVGAHLDVDSSVQSGSAYIFTTPNVYTPYDVVDLNSYGQ